MVTCALEASGTVTSAGRPVTGTLSAATAGVRWMPRLAVCAALRRIRPWASACGAASVGAASLEEPQAVSASSAEVRRRTAGRRRMAMTESGG